MMSVSTEWWERPTPVMCRHGFFPGKCLSECCGNAPGNPPLVIPPEDWAPPDNPRISPTAGIVGTTIGRLTVLQKLRSSVKGTMFLCECECGARREFRGCRLLRAQRDGTLIACGHRCPLRARHRVNF